MSADQHTGSSKIGLESTGVRLPLFFCLSGIPRTEVNTIKDRLGLLVPSPLKKILSDQLVRLIQYVQSGQ